ncbi:unnamed protein product [Aphanomyces euteiches]|uniref:DUF1764 domain-containing protein n=1 Tax=Aphanomyces euteiches TaxID=100861 RepID=A0A6G0W882_9STRA|nr:hypothetical protein Ae201684_018202 [Aphanomyces euteiches]KAH9076468.1 hypothetical protein Ae201684P_010412 [Aphanomyces euteiches]KAH9138285.1 hypothetical protein AeRB84_017381 [Aphanomyces euteiches]
MPPSKHPAKGPSPAENASAKKSAKVGVDALFSSKKTALAKGPAPAKDGSAKKSAKAGVDALFASKKATQAKVSKEAKKTTPGAPETEKKDKKNARLELDALFSNIKSKKQQKLADDEAIRRQVAKEEAEKRAYRKHLEELEAEHKRKHNDTSDPKPIRYDADGLAIYSEESLRINQGGDTADCPFDCWCCF